jgi:hypothetical protein
VKLSQIIKCILESHKISKNHSTHLKRSKTLEKLNQIK